MYGRSHLYTQLTNFDSNIITVLTATAYSNLINGSDRSWWCHPRCYSFLFGRTGSIPERFHPLPRCRQEGHPLRRSRRLHPHLQVNHFAIYWSAPDRFYIYFSRFLNYCFPLILQHETRAWVHWEGGWIEVEGGWWNLVHQWYVCSSSLLIINRTVKRKMCQFVIFNWKSWLK